MNLAKDPKAATREVDATPYASALIEGHRDFGYSLETALADIVDNAISAGANWVQVIADTVAEDPWIAIADDGGGMTEAELVEAMRLGLEESNGYQTCRRSWPIRTRSKERQLFPMQKPYRTVPLRRRDVLRHVGIWIASRRGTTGRWSSSTMQRM